MVGITLGLLMARSFYVDPNVGNDSATGLSPLTAWKTLSRAAREEFRPNDRLLLRGQAVMPGGVTISGTTSLSIESYGGGLATIQAGTGDGLAILNSTRLRVKNLNIVGPGRKSNDGYGLRLERVRSSEISNLKVSGFRSGGLTIDGSTEVKVSRVVAQGNGASGIEVRGGYGTLPRSSKIQIADCKAIGNLGDPKNLTNHSGNGIIVGGVDDCLIEFCEAAENGADMPREGNGPVGIWAWNASKVRIRNSISHDNKSPGTDGGGFDLDGGVRDSVIENCLSYGNVGAGYLVCQYQGGDVVANNVIRNCISFLDGTKNMNSGIALFRPSEMKNIRGILFENNTIINDRFAVSTMEDISQLTFRRNVLIAKEDLFKLIWGPGGFKGATIEQNLGWQRAGVALLVGVPELFSDPVIWATGRNRSIDPKIRIPSSTSDLPTDPRKLASMGWFVPAPDSPCRDGKRVIFGANLGVAK
jgi:hypothetical protein